ncbi:MAG: ATP-dependent Clp protease adaptor ClpS [Luteibaculaceae bacterium]
MGNYQVEEDVLLASDVDDEKEIILFNDDFNTFDFVIESLMEVCNHDLTQATQCTMLVHYKGKCSVKKGSLEKLLPKKRALVTRGLTAEIH